MFGVAWWLRMSLELRGPCLRVSLTLILLAFTLLSSFYSSWFIALFHRTCWLLDHIAYRVPEFSCDAHQMFISCALVICSSSNSSGLCLQCSAAYVFAVGRSGSYRSVNLLAAVWSRSVECSVTFVFCQVVIFRTTADTHTHTRARARARLFCVKQHNQSQVCFKKSIIPYTSSWRNYSNSL